MVQQRFSVFATEGNWEVCFLSAVRKAWKSGRISRHDYYELRRSVLNDSLEEDGLDV